jgi:predicted CopG family antitoxin
MVTTIQLNENVKRALDRLKNNKETYEQVILNLMKIAEKSKRDQKQLLIEGCKVMAEESLKITRKFEAIEDFKDWEWKDCNNGNKKRRNLSS